MVLLRSGYRGAIRMFLHLLEHIEIAEKHGNYEFLRKEYNRAIQGMCPCNVTNAYHDWGSSNLEMKEKGMMISGKLLFDPFNKKEVDK